MKVYKIKPMLTEQVRLSIKGNKRVIDNEKGAWYEVVWLSNGDFELHSLKPSGVGTYEANRPANIPFSPITSDNHYDYKWGDRE